MDIAVATRPVRTPRRGVATLTASVQEDNGPALGLVRRLLPGASVTPDGGVLAVRSTGTRSTTVPALAGA